MTRLRAGRQRHETLSILFAPLLLLGAMTEAMAGGMKGDFNGDGYDDLAIGVPGEDLGPAGNAGAVNVIYGSKKGLRAKGDQFWHQDVFGVKDRAEAAEEFGTALAVGDFDKDGFDDLAIGVPGESIFTNLVSASNTGAVNVLYGSKKGLTAKGDQFWYQSKKGIKNTSETDDRFGEALTAGDFNLDGYDDLAIGVPFEDIGALMEAGAVNVIYGSKKGLRAKGNQFWHQDTKGIREVAEAFDRFGSALAAGQLGKSGHADLAIGVRFEGIGAADQTGAVNVLYGTKKGLRAKGNQLWHQDSPMVKDQAEGGENFGYALAVGRFNKDGFDDLAIGAPFESLGTANSAGAVNLLYGAAGGLTATGNQFWHQDSTGVEEMAGTGDFFGRALTAGRFNKDRYDDLAVGAPSEDAFFLNGGVVNVLYGAKKGLRAKGDQLWHQDSAGILGSTVEFDLFGSALSAGDFDNDGIDDLPISVPGDLVSAGAVNVIYGARKGLRSKGNQLWHQNRPGIEDVAEIADGFGAALP